jgi:protease IV
MSWGKRRIVVILILVAAVVLFAIALTSSSRISSNTVLVLEVSGDIQEQRPNDWVSALSGTFIPVQHEFVDAIDTAKTDSRITGLVVKIGPLETGWAKLEEIHAHLMAFRQSHKPSICYLGYDGIGNPEYFLASACDQVWLVPTAPVDISGMMGEAVFLRGTLDKLKIYPDMYHIAEYKTASNQLTEKKFTPAHREEVDSLLHSIYGQYLDQVSAARHIDRAKFENLVKKGPYLSKEALQTKLVDKLAYWDEVQNLFEKKNGNWKTVGLGRYRSEVKNEGREALAVVYATGLIASGDSGNSPGGGLIMGGDSVAGDLRRAREDSSIKAIILRVDSGGGSAVASEVIRREVQLARQEKPVVISMSDVAASGGYWISMSANRIVAEPGTITGSIGVVIGKLNLSGFYNLIGLSTDYVATSENATLFWDQQNFTPAQRQSIQKGMQDTYNCFTQGVAEGRKMTVEAVDKIGRGRVWSGEQAKSLGLADELGGLNRAIAVAKQLAGIPAEKSVRIVRLPEEKTFFEQLFSRGRSDTLTNTTLEAKIRWLTRISEPVQVRMPFDLQIR